MVMTKCPKCKVTLCDPQLYYGIKEKKSKQKESLKMIIECPSCEYRATLKEFLETT